MYVSYVAAVIFGAIVVALNIEYWRARASMSPEQRRSLKQAERHESYWW